MEREVIKLRMEIGIGGEENYNKAGERESESSELVKERVIKSKVPSFNILDSDFYYLIF